MKNEELSIAVIGASGSLAGKKIFPALFALYSQGLLPENTNIFGFARSRISEEQFRNQISANLTCRYKPDPADCADTMQKFLGRCRYVSGKYSSPDSFLDLYQAMQNAEVSRQVNHLFYLAIPPSIFTDTAHAIGSAGFVQCDGNTPWSRVVVEKPFGKDRKSSDELIRSLGDVFSEVQTYRMDHYLGKEVVQNLLVLRFANLVFEPIWNSEFIDSISICWKENLGVEGRGGYFDEYGIIRDVMQNHLIQILSLIAMDTPANLTPASIAKEKTKVLRCIPPVELQDTILGQYTAGILDSRKIPGYTDDETVPGNSITPTFASAELKIDNIRWKGVPFRITAGKGLNESSTEIHIRFKAVENNIFCNTGQCPQPNEMIIRVQPDEAIYLRLTNKVPGPGMRLDVRNLDLQYKLAFSEIIADAYESLILDVIKGDRSLFITREELAAAWDIFTPLLHQIEKEKTVPENYPFGSENPFTPGNVI